MFLSLNSSCETQRDVVANAAGNLDFNTPALLFITTLPDSV